MGSGTPGKLAPGRRKFQRGLTKPKARSRIRRPVDVQIEDSGTGWFYNLRSELAIGRDELANRTNLARSAIEKWEIGMYEPTFRSLRKIADIYDMDIWLEFRPKTHLGGMDGPTDEE